MWSTVIWFQNFVQNSNIISCTSLSHRRPYNSKMGLKNHATFSKCEKEKFFSYFEMEIYYTYGECDEIFRQFQHALRYRDDSMTCNYPNNIFWNLCLWILYLLKKWEKTISAFSTTEPWEITRRRSRGVISKGEVGEKAGMIFVFVISEKWKI